MNLDTIISLLKIHYGCIEEINTLEKIKAWARTRISAYPELLMFNIAQRLLESEKFDVASLIQSLAQLLRSKSISAVPMAKYDFCNALVTYINRSYTIPSSRAPVREMGGTALLAFSPLMSVLNRVCAQINNDYQTSPLESFLEGNMPVAFRLLQDNVVRAMSTFFETCGIRSAQQVYMFKLMLRESLHEDPIIFIGFIEKFFVSEGKNVLLQKSKKFNLQACETWFEQSYVTSCELSVAIGYLPDSQERAQILYILDYLCKIVKSRHQGYDDLQKLKTHLERDNFSMVARMFEQQTKLEIFKPDSNIKELCQSLYHLIRIIVCDFDPRNGDCYLHAIHDNVTESLYAKLEERFKCHLKRLLRSSVMETHSFTHEGVASSLGGPPADILLAAELARQMSYCPVVFPITSMDTGSEDPDLGTTKYEVMFQTPMGIPLTLLARLFSRDSKIDEKSVMQVKLIHKLFPGFEKHPLYAYEYPNDNYRLFFKPVFNLAPATSIAKLVRTLGKERGVTTATAIFKEQVRTMTEAQLLEKAYHSVRSFNKMPPINLDLALQVLATQQHSTMKEESVVALRNQIASDDTLTAPPLRDITKKTIPRELQIALLPLSVWNGSPYGLISHYIDVDFSKLSPLEMCDVLHTLRDVSPLCQVIPPAILPYLSLRATAQVVNVIFDIDAQLLQVTYPPEISARFNIINRKGGKVFLHQSNMQGWDICNVPDDGNCFYHAVVDQLQKLELEKELLEKPAPHLLLREKTQRGEYKDGEWVGENEIINFTTVFPNIAIAIMDVGIPEQGYTVLFCRGQKCTREDILPYKYIHILRLAFTRNHYMSVLTNPLLTQGYLQERYDNNDPRSKLRGIPLDSISSLKASFGELDPGEIKDSNNQPMLCGTHYSNKGVKKNEAMILASFFNITWINDLPPAERGLGRVIIDSDVSGSESYFDDIHVSYQGIQCKTPSCVDNAFFTARKAQSLGYKVCLLEQDVHLVTLISYPDSMNLQDVLIKIEAEEIAEDTNLWNKYLEWTGVNHSTNRDISTRYSPSTLVTLYEGKLSAQYKYYLETGEIFSTLSNSSLMLPELDATNYLIEQYTLNNILQQFYSTVEHNNFLVDALADMANLTDVEDQIAVLSQFILPYAIDGNYEGDYAQLIQILLSHYNLQSQHNMTQDSSHTTQLVLGGETIVLEGGISHSLEF